MKIKKLFLGGHHGQPDFSSSDDSDDDDGNGDGDGDGGEDGDDDDENDGDADDGNSYECMENGDCSEAASEDNE